jgi:hypothetical protein
MVLPLKPAKFPANMLLNGEFKGALDDIVGGKAVADKAGGGAGVDKRS